MKCHVSLLSASLLGFGAFFLACGGSDVPLGNGANQNNQSSDVALGTSPDASATAEAWANVWRGPLDPANALRAAAFLGSCNEGSQAGVDLANIYIALMYQQNHLGLRRSSQPAFVDLIDCLATKTGGCASANECIAASPTTSSDGRTSEACNKDSFVDSCRDGEPTFCSSNDTSADASDGTVSLGPMCADFGLECGVGDPRKIAVCRGGGGACEGDGVSGVPLPIGAFIGGMSCAGNTLTACVNGGATQIDCSKVGVGFTCQTMASQPTEPAQVMFCGLASECDPRPNGSDVLDLGIQPPTCDGTKLVVCNAGRLDSIDCTTLGFTGCNAGACL